MAIVRQTAVLVLVLLALVGTMLVAGPGGRAGATEAAPFMTATATPDVARGGTVVELQLHEMYLPANDDWLSVHLSKDGVEQPLDPWGDLSLRCPAVDPATPDGVTNRCSFFAPTVRTAGTYDVVVYVNSAALADEFGAAFTLAQDLPAWWLDHELLQRTTDPFTGATRMTVVFDPLPSGVGLHELQLSSDSDHDGRPDTVGATMPCTLGDGGTVTCVTTGTGIPPLCVQDEAGGAFCDDGDHTWTVTANGVEVPGLGYQAVLYRMSRLEEGRFFARRAWDDPDHLLADELDLDRFVLGELEPCTWSNGPSCYEYGYYTEWMSLWRDNVTSLVAGVGRFAVAAQGTSVTADVAVPRLPVGAHGVHVELVVRRGEDVRRATLDCSAAACAPVTLTGLAPGRWTAQLELHDDHPYVEFDDGSTWGQQLLAVVGHPAGFTLGDSAPAGALRAVNGAVSAGRGDASLDTVRVQGWARRGGDGAVRGAVKLRVRAGQLWLVRDGVPDSIAEAGGLVTVTGTGTLKHGARVAWRLTLQDGVGEPDAFRVQVWREGRPTKVLYDSQPGAPLDAAPTLRAQDGDVRVVRDAAVG